jgi:prepilin peptidase CpaA
VIQTVASLLVTVILCVAAWLDATTRRIPNQLILAGLGAAFALRVPLGWEASLRGLEGFGIALVVALLFYALGAMGGGDAKLIAVVGAFLGLNALAGALAYIVLLGAALALVMMARRGLLFLLLLNTLELFRTRRFLARADGSRMVDAPTALTIPYGVPIAAGSLLWWFGQGVKL